MTTAQPADEPLADDEVYVYLRPDAGGWEAAPERPEETEQEAFESHFGHSTAKDQGLAKVKLSDDELDRLRGQVQRIASKLEAPGDAENGNRFAVDEITVHVGISASGQFFFIASAGVEASVDVTWRRHHNSGS